MKYLALIALASAALYLNNASVDCNKVKQANVQGTSEFAADVQALKEMCNA